MGLRGVKPRPVHESLLANFEVPEDERQCWEWTGPRNHNGYGVISTPEHRLRAHRVAWELYVGPIPPGHVVCHTCDNPSCINLEHLFVGTQADNLRDMREKGRGRKMPTGADNPNTKLNPEIARKVRSEHRFGQRGHGAGALAARYGVSRGTIAAILEGRTWRDA